MKWIGAWRGDFPLRALLRGKGRGRVASGTVRRRVEGPHGPIEYTLTAKKVKNFNLRIGPDGGVKVSVPRSVSAAQAESVRPLQGGMDRGSPPPDGGAPSAGPL